MGNVIYLQGGLQHIGAILSVTTQVLDFTSVANHGAFCPPFLVPSGQSKLCIDTLRHNRNPHREAPFKKIQSHCGKQALLFNMHSQKEFLPGAE